MPPFTKEKDKMLISLVKSKLYKPTPPGYNDQLAKSLAWEEISEELQIPLPAIRRRWKYIKDQWRKNAQAKVQNDADSKFTNTKIDIRDRMVKKRVNSEWFMIILPEEGETENPYYIDNTDDADSIETEEKNETVENTDTRKGLFETIDSFKRIKILDDLKQKYGRGTKVEKTIAQHMETLNIENNIDDIQNLNGKKRRLISNNHEDLEYESNDNFDSDKNVIISDIMDFLRRKLDFRLKTKKYNRISNISNAKRSSMHKFFEEAAGIVTMFPPELACEICLMIYGEIIDMEMD